MPTATTHRDGDTLYVQGELDFDSVARLWDATESLFLADPPHHINLSEVRRANSAGVALLVAWLRQVSPLRKLVFINVPMQMQAIIQVADLETILPSA
ncbi:MAG: STAS domain-containing protein [Candidatus Competibacteraceae bacterium]